MSPSLSLKNFKRPARNLFRLLALLVNGAIGVVYIKVVFFQGNKPCIPCGLFAICFLAMAVLLLLALLGRLPAWGPRAMRYLCIGLPAVWLLGSFDHGILSSQELLLSLVIALLAWGSWKAFQEKAPASVR